MESAVAAVEWFIAETARIYSTWSESADDRRLRALIDWLEQRDGRGAVRDMIAAKLYRKAAEAEADLAKLIAAGDVEPRTVPPEGRGRPATEYVLTDRRRSAS